MYWPDTNTGVDVEPARKPVASVVRKFFTEGGSGQPPTVPGGDWFNQITNELLNVLVAAGIDPSKTDDDQLLQAITAIINSGVEVSGVLSASPEFVDIPAYENELFNVQMQALLNRLASISGATTMGTASGQTVQTALDEINADRNKSLLSKIKFKRQFDNAPWGQPGPINVLGDSISEGYFASYEGSPMAGTAGGMYYHRWVSILARMFAAEFNTGHYITCNPNLTEYAGDEDIVKRTAVNGAWALKNTGAYTSDLMVGRALCSSIQGDYMEFTFPATFDACWIHYVIQPGGGDLSISQNGAAPTVISCNNPVFTYAVARLDVVSNPQGYCVIRLSKSDSSVGEVGISAVSPSQGVRESGGAIDGGGLNVFAAGGRRLQDLSEAVIADACLNASALIMALGFNDNALNGEGQEVGRAAFTQRIDWIIEYCNLYETPLIIPDFSWKNTSDQFTRTELRRASSETGGLYIPLPDMLKNGAFPTESERLDSGLWKDGAHPAKKGHQWIAEAIAKSIGLSCTSKNQALRFHDYWISLPLTATYANILTNIPRNLAAYKINGDTVQLRTQIKLASGAPFPVGVNQVCGTSAHSMFWIRPPVKLNAYYLTKLHQVNENTGVLQGFSALKGADAVSGVLSLIRSTGVSLVEFNGASSHEIDRWESFDN